MTGRTFLVTLCHPSADVPIRTFDSLDVAKEFVVMNPITPIKGRRGWTSGVEVMEAIELVAGKELGDAVPEAFMIWKFVDGELVGCEWAGRASSRKVA